MARHTSDNSIYLPACYILVAVRLVYEVLDVHVHVGVSVLNETTCTSDADFRFNREIGHETHHEMSQSEFNLSWQNTHLSLFVER